MTDEDALLAAILADPEDDTPRLVFADWLDENEASVTCERCDGTGCTFCGGEDRDYHSSCNECNRCDGSGFVSNGYAAKADLIRIQCELAKHWHGVGDCSCRQLIDKYDCDNCLTWERTEELRDRERELFASLPLELPDGFFRCVSTVAYMYSRLRSDPLAVYDRGFVDSVSCPWDAWRDHGDAILAAQPVRKVRLTTDPPFRWQMANVPHDWPNNAGFEEMPRRVALDAFRHRWPSVREWALPPDPNLIPDHLQDSASAFIASGRMIEGEIIDVPLPPTR